MILLAFIVACNLAYAQKPDTTAIFSIEKTNLLSKSKLQKTTGWIIFGTGTPAVAVTGYLLIAFNKNDIDKPLVTKIFIASVAYTLVSVPLIIAGNRNKRKALSISFIENKIALPQLSSTSFTNQPAVSLTIHL